MLRYSATKLAVTPCWLTKYASDPLRPEDRATGSTFVVNLGKQSKTKSLNRTLALSLSTTKNFFLITLPKNLFTFCEDNNIDLKKKLRRAKVSIVKYY